MASLEFETTVAASLDRVWAFFEDVTSALPALSPPEDQVRIESADLPVREGSRIVIRARGPFGEIRWVAKIVEHRPPHPVVFGEEARFVDEQEEGPFSAWRHEHDFERVDDKSTRVLDRVTYRVPFGPAGWVVEPLVRRKVSAMFRYRQEKLRAQFGAAG